MKQALRTGLIAIAAIVAIGLYASIFTVGQMQQALVLQFGRVRAVLNATGEDKPGLYFKVPFVENVVIFDKRVLDLDLPVQTVLTADRQNLEVDAFARYRILDPLRFYQAVGNIGLANQRLASFTNSGLRNVLARSTRDAIVKTDRGQLMHQIQEDVNRQAKALGIEIVDLRGDVRRGERAGMGADQGVFNIQVGTAITLAVADGSKASGELAAVLYNDSWIDGYVSRQAKLNWLVRSAEAGALDGAIEVDRAALDDMRPLPFLNGDLVSIAQCFSFFRSGLQTKRDDFLYAFTANDVSCRIRGFLSATDAEAARLFHNTRDRSATRAQAIAFDAARVREISYRPLDRRYIYNHPRYGDFLRPELQEAWGHQNFALYAMPSGTGDGPAVWCHGLLPDYHAFRGSYGGYAFPLYDRRAGHGPSNLNVLLVEALGAAYGTTVTAEAVFDAILTLLSAASYTTRFAEDLEDVFPHIPFPSDPTIFRDAVAIGADIRMVQTFARRPGSTFLQGRARALTAPEGPLGVVEWTDGSITLCANGSGRIENVPHAVWEFSVSGYRVVPHWLAAREGIEIGATFIPELRDLIGRVAELNNLFATADGVLQRTLDSPLSLAALGLTDQDILANDDPAD